MDKCRPFLTGKILYIVLKTIQSKDTIKFLFFTFLNNVRQIFVLPSMNPIIVVQNTQQ